LHSKLNCVDIHTFELSSFIAISRPSVITIEVNMYKIAEYLANNAKHLSKRVRSKLFSVFAINYYANKQQMLPMF